MNLIRRNAKTNDVIIVLVANLLEFVEPLLPERRKVYLNALSIYYTISF